MKPIRDQVVEAAVSRERAIFARRGALVRLVTVSAVLFLVLAFSATEFDPALAAIVPLSVLYVVLAVFIYLAVRRSVRLDAPAVALATLVDMPILFAMTIVVLDHSSTPIPDTMFLVASLLVIAFCHIMALSSWQVVGFSALGVVLSSVLMLHFGLDLDRTIEVAILFAVVAFVGAYTLRRMIRMIGNAAMEQVRRERLARYFSPDVAAVLAARSDEGAARTAGEATILVSDLRGFTTLAERLSPGEVFDLLNEVHARMVSVIFANGGTLDKFMGDGILATFGAPIANPGHARSAVRCALDMQREVERFNAERARAGKSPLRLGIGVHSGDVMWGDIDTPGRREFTVLGDAVNVASRIEAMTKTKGDGILVSETTCGAAGPGFEFVEVGTEPVRGRSAPVRLFAPRDSARAGT